MAPFIDLPAGYGAKTITYKSVGSLNLDLDVLYPQEKSPDPVPVLIHYHGGFLVSIMPFQHFVCQTLNNYNCRLSEIGSLSCLTGS